MYKYCNLTENFRRVHDLEDQRQHRPPRLITMVAKSTVSD
jgi:hypothetical protein